MTKPTTTTLASLSLGCLAACYSGAPGSADDSIETGDGDRADDGSEKDDSGDTSEGAGDGADTGDTGDTTDAPIVDLGTSNSDPNEDIPPFDEEGCHAIYAQDLLPTFELTIHPAVWDELMWRWNGRDNLKDEGVDMKKYFPLEEFRYGDIVIRDAEIRLRGNETNWDPIPGDRMQFQIGFHRNDEENGHFLGLERLVIEAHSVNRHMLRDRLSLKIMREFGVTAPCCNNARVVINGEYYGLFTNVEKIDEVFLERAMDDPTGDLWKRHGWTLKTNQDTSNDARLEALLDAESTEEVYTYLSFEQALREYAADAVTPNGDGKWAGGLNFYLYDHPIDGKFWLLPWDMDNTLDRFDDPLDGEYPMLADPVVWEKGNTHGRPWYEAALEDDMWFEYYIDLIDELVSTIYVADKLHAQIDEMTAQIEDSVLEDPNKPWTNEEYYDEVQNLHDLVDIRYEFLVEWLQCWRDGGEKDEDGYCDPP